MDGPVTESRVEVQRETLTGDVRDLLLDFVKHYNEALPFNALSENKQLAIVERIDRYASELIEEAVGIVAADGRESVRMAVKTIGQSEKGEIIAKLRCSFNADTWAMLGSASTVELVIADSRAYQGERRSKFKHISRDQKSMFSDEEGDDSRETPVMDQTDAGKKLGGKAPEEPDRPKKAKKPETREDVLREIAAKALLIAEHEEKPIEDAIREAMKALKASCTPEELETVRKITGFDDGKMGKDGPSPDEDGNSDPKPDDDLPE